jgi:hypothetical protein
VDAAASRGEHAHAPVAELVADALDHDGRRIRHRARGRLILQVLKEVLGGARVQVVVTDEAIERRGGGDTEQIAHQTADREAELQGPPRAIALPEGHLAGLAGRRRHQHAIVRDLLDAPRRGAEHEGLADAALEHHLLVELADARRARPRAEQEDAEQPAVGNRAAVGDRDALRALARDEGAGGPVPGDPRTEVGELVRRIAAREHVEHALERGPAQLCERRRAPQRGEQIVDLPLVHRRHRDDLLRRDVERVSRIARRFHRPVVHGPGDGGAGDEIAAELREDHPFADRTDVMSSAPDALQAARDRRRRFDLDDEIDRAHVDPELQRRGGDERPQHARFQQVLDLHALRARNRAVVRAHERFAGELVQRAGQTFGEPPAVHEDQRGSVAAYQFEQPRMDRRPDRRTRRARRGAARDVVARLRSGRSEGAPGRRRRADPGQVLDRHLDLQVERLLCSGVDDRDRPVAHRSMVSGELLLDLSRGAASVGRRLASRPRAGGRRPRRGAAGRALHASEKPRHLLERALGRRQPDPLGRLFAARRQPLDRHREVGAPLGRHERVNLVDDDRMHVPERLARIRREHQVQRLRCRDQNIRGLALKPRPLRGRRVARADGDRRGDVGGALAVRDACNPGERRAQVALHVHGERLERRHVHHAAPLERGRRRREHQAVEAPEERRERFAAPRRREDQRRFAAGDRRPPERLRPRRLLERRCEPGAHRRMKRLKWRGLHLCLTSAGYLITSVDDQFTQLPHALRNTTSWVTPAKA